MLIEASQSRAGRLSTAGAVQYVTVWFAALGADRPAKPLFRAGGAGRVGRHLVKIPAI